MRFKAGSASDRILRSILRQDLKSEDEGMLVATVYDSIRNENFLLVLDASDLRELARAYTGVAW